MGREIPKLENLDLITLGEKSLSEVVEERQKAQEEIKKLKASIAEADLLIGAALDVNGLKTVRWKEDYVVCRVEPSKPRRTIDPAKLIELGVPAHVIQAASKFGAKGKPRVQVRRVGTDGEIPEEKNTGEEENPIDGWYEI